MSPRVITDGIPATPVLGYRGDSGGGSGLIFGAPAISGLTNPGLSGDTLSSPTRSVNAIAIKVTLMHVIDDTMTGTFGAQPSCGIPRRVVARYAAWFHYGIDGLPCQGTMVCAAPGHAGTVFATGGRKRFDVRDMSGRRICSVQEQVGEG